MSLPVHAWRRLVAARTLPLALAGAVGLAAPPASAVDKAADAAQPPALPAAAEPAALRALPDSYTTCSAQPDGTIVISSASFGDAVAECTLQAPTAGYIVAIGSASLAMSDTAYEVHAEIMLDDAQGDSSDRWVNVYPNANDGTDKTIAISHYFSVAPGARRISFKARRYSGGNVMIFDPTLTAIFVPASAAQTVCGSATGTTFQTQSSAPVSAASCQISVAEDSIAFAFATASMGYSLGPTEARVRIGFDGTTTSTSDRWVNVYADDQDGTDESVATQYAFAATPGTHTFDLYASRFDGSGQVTMYDPVLTVIAVPTSAAAICSQQSGASYTNPGGTATTMRECTLSTATPARALVFASASIGRSDPPAGAPYEGLFRIATGGESLSNTERWIDIDNDSGDGTDRTLATQWGGELDPGTFTFSLRGSRYSGSGEVRAYNAALHVLLLPSDRLFYSDFELP